MLALEGLPCSLYTLHDRKEYTVALPFYRCRRKNEGKIHIYDKRYTLNGIILPFSRSVIGCRFIHLFLNFLFLRSPFALLIPTCSYFNLYCRFWRYSAGNNDIVGRHTFTLLVRSKHLSPSRCMGNHWRLGGSSSHG